MQVHFWWQPYLIFLQYYILGLKNLRRKKYGWKEKESNVICHSRGGKEVLGAGTLKTTNIISDSRSEGLGIRSKSLPGGFHIMEDVTNRRLSCQNLEVVTLTRIWQIGGCGNQEIEAIRRLRQSGDGHNQEIDITRKWTQPGDWHSQEVATIKTLLHSEGCNNKEVVIIRWLWQYKTSDK